MLPASHPPFSALPEVASPPVLGALATQSGTAPTLRDMVGAELLLFSCAVLCVIACAAILFAFRARREASLAQELAQSRARSMEELLNTVRMAESIADLGVWQYDPTTGEQQWSDGMRQLFGIDHRDEFLAGDAETLLFANDVDLIGNVMENVTERSPYHLRYEIHGYDGRQRILGVEACNLIGDGGKVVRIIAVVRDVTRQMSRELALENSRCEAMREALVARELADTDPLTGLANRRKVMADLDRLILNARKREAPMVLLVFDIDRFKQVNDTFGHPEGDKVIRRVAEIAKEQAREGDVVGRIGGEEFIWVVPSTGRLVANQLAERLREAVASESAVGAVPGVTLSVGLATLRPDDTSLTLVSRADNALYDAKEGGRNRVKLAA